MHMRTNLWATITTAPDGKPGKSISFDPLKEKDEWAEWNQKRDKLIR